MALLLIIEFVRKAHNLLALFYVGLAQTKYKKHAAAHKIILDQIIRNTNTSIDSNLQNITSHIYRYKGANSTTYYL
jgi:hypothetical protein